MTSDSDQPDLVPGERLDAWLGDTLPGQGRLEVRRVTSGHSNELFTLSRGSDVWMLRRPPRVPNAPTAHDMQREYRVLSALEGTAVPHAQARLFCDDDAVMGAPFYVMDQVPGVALYESLPEALATERVGIAHQAIDALAALHSLDWEAAGLAGLGKPVGYTERQAPRWAHQLASYATRDLPELRDVAEWLNANCPKQRGSVLIHGDFGLHNLLFAPGAPATLLAVVDWETATLGDPLADLGYFLADWLEPGEWDRWGALGSPHGVKGNPTRSELIARYASLTDDDLDADDLTWYRVLGQFKIAVILEGSYGRFTRGESSDQFFASLEQRVPLLAQHALAIAAGDA